MHTRTCAHICHRAASHDGSAAQHGAQRVTDAARRGGGRGPPSTRGTAAAFPCRSRSRQRAECCPRLRRALPGRLLVRWA